jgi:hypothetical protein
MPIDIDIDISRILSVAEHYGGEVAPSTMAIVAQLTRAIAETFEQLKRDINDKLETLERRVKGWEDGPI